MTISNCPARCSPGQDVEVQVDLANTGSRAGDEVVMLFVHDVVSSVTTPVKQLKAFRRVSLEPGAKATVKLTVKYDQLAMLNAAHQWVVEPGRFDVFIGSLKGQF